MIEPVAPGSATLRSFLTDPEVFRGDPARSVRLLARVTTALAGATTICILTYWGVGRRSYIAEPEHDALAFLSAWLERWRTSFRLDLDVTVLGTDTHAVVNQLPRESTGNYLTEIERCCAERGWSFMRASALLRGQTGFNPDGLGETRFAAGQATWLRLRSRDREELVRLARLHAEGLDAERAAIEYVGQNLLERPVLTAAYAGRIFVTYSVPSLKWLLPDLPTIFAYVSVNSEVRRPWFRDPPC